MTLPPEAEQGNGRKDPVVTRILAVGLVTSVLVALVGQVWLDVQRQQPDPALAAITAAGLGAILAQLGQVFARRNG